MRRALTPASIPDRVPEKETVSRAVLPLARPRGRLWAHSAEPLRQPLLRRVHADAELRDVACRIFIDILSRPACPSPAARPPGGRISQGTALPRGPRGPGLGGQR